MASGCQLAYFYPHPLPNQLPVGGTSYPTGILVERFELHANTGCRTCNFMTERGANPQFFREQNEARQKKYIQLTYTHYTSLHTFQSLLPDIHTPYHLLPNKSTGFVTMPIARVGAMPNDDNLDKSKEEGKNGRSKATRRKGITIEVGQVWTAAYGLAF